MTRGGGQVHEPGCTGSTALLVLAPIAGRGILRGTIGHDLGSNVVFGDLLDDGDSVAREVCLSDTG
jgi:hypothetical protein